MPICKKCGEEFPYRAIVDGKERNFSSRKYCLKCSPFGKHNTQKLEKLSKEALYMRKYRETHPEYKPYKPGYGKRVRTAGLQKIADDKNNGIIECISCGFDENISILEINHIKGGGRKETQGGLKSLQFWRDIVAGKRST